ncbi:MAG: LmbE family protein [Cyanobacteria bacterium PR.3.49]|nr:LmbE family protein [Cyanobacteria bacterium PR.3.49]
MNSDSPQAILHELESFRQMGSVLYIAAHPDDENTELLAYLSRGRNYRTAYLSLTRGDGGQNVLGADLGAKLGVARTQELLAARQIDGAQQFFTRAKDYGFSKNYLETMTVWDKQEVLSDIVRVIRKFRPDILITRFSPSPGGTHGHHTTSTVLAMEAFKLAGDPKAFPEHDLPPWQPKRILWNASIWQKDKITDQPVYKIDATGKDPVSGETFHSIAGASRAMHKTQGFDTFKMPGGDGEKRLEQFQLLDGAPITADIMEGVDTSWARIEGGSAIGKDAGEVIEKFDIKDPAASVPSLLKLRKEVNSLTAKHKDDGEKSVLLEKQALLDRILAECLGLKVETTISHSDVVPGEPMNLLVSASLKSKPPKNLQIKWLEVRLPKLPQEKCKKKIDRVVDEPQSIEVTETLPVTTPLTQPYWLLEDGTPGMFDVKNGKLIGTAENAPSFPVEYEFLIDGLTLVINDEPVQVTKDSLGNEIRRRLDVIPPVSMRFLSEVAVMRPGSSRSVEVEIRASRANSHGTLELQIAGAAQSSSKKSDSAQSESWKIDPPAQPFNLAAVGDTAKFVFKITAPESSTISTAQLTATAVIDGEKYHNQRQEVNYPHLPRQLLQPPAVMHAVSFDLATRGHTVGYLPGAGDTLAENLQEMGYAVKVLDDANLTAKDLEGLDAVVVGVRALNVRNNIANAMPILFSYVENGGTLIVQYNRHDKLKADKVAPYDLQISNDRVTDEKAPVKFLAPDSPILNVPNKITSADFDGWVQERGLYFPNKWDSRFTPILAFNDIGEDPHEGALLAAKYGKGNYIYTGLGFFRQLPAGVPGAYRLFANMVSIGK